MVITMIWNFPPKTFNDSEFNCLDQSIALCASRFNIKNYYYYCFYLTMCMLWDIDFPEEFTVHRNTILNRIGLNLVKIPCTNSNFLIKCTELIDQNKPVILFLKKCILPYIKNPCKKNSEELDDTLHGVIVSDYYNCNICLMENLHLKETQLLHNDSFNLYEFWLNRCIVENMWITSNYIPDEFGVSNNVFVVEENDSKDITSFKQLIKDIFENCRVCSDNFINLLKRDCFDPSILGDDSFIVGIRRQHIIPRKAMLDCAILMCKEDNNKESFVEFSKMYLAVFDQIINRLCILAKRKKILNLIEREGMVSKMEKLNLRLFEFLDSIEIEDIVVD